MHVLAFLMLLACGTASAGFLDTLTSGDEIAPVGFHFMASIEHYGTVGPNKGKGIVVQKCEKRAGVMRDGMAAELNRQYAQGRTDAAPSPMYLTKNFGVTSAIYSSADKAAVLAGAHAIVFTSVFGISKSLCEALVELDSRQVEQPEK